MVLIFIIFIIILENKTIENNRNFSDFNKDNNESIPIYIKLVNTLNNLVFVKWELLLNDNETWQKGNIAININEPRTITINNTKLLKSGSIVLTAKDLETGKILNIGNTKNLVLKLNELNQNTTLEIKNGNIRLNF